MTSEWLDKGHECQGTIRTEAEKLTWLASSFYDVGNDYVAERLNRASNRLHTQADTVGEVLSAVIDNGLAEAKDSSASALVFALKFSELLGEKKLGEDALIEAQLAIIALLNDIERAEHTGNMSRFYPG